MKQLFLLFLTTLAFASTIFGQASDVAHETINAMGVEHIKLDLGTRDIEIKSTKGSRVIIESRVTISMPNETLLKYLIDSGRYGVETSTDASNGTLTIARKRSSNVLIVKGKECEEKFGYIVFIPESIKFTQKVDAFLILGYSVTANLPLIISSFKLIFYIFS